MVNIFKKLHVWPESADTEGRVMVVRLSGDTPGQAQAKPEGQGLTAADVGDTFTLSGPYLSYAAQWLGDTELGAILEWNDAAYVAGQGNGTAGYANASLPGLASVYGVVHNDKIQLKALAGAFVELRFRSAV